VAGERQLAQVTSTCRTTPEAEYQNDDAESGPAAFASNQNDPFRRCAGPCLEIR